MLSGSYYSNLRYEVFKYCGDHVSSVCEYGCGEGVTLMEVASKLGVKEVYGFDILELKNAPFSYKKIDLNRSDEISKFVPKVDLYMYLDVLEHLVNPFGFLKMVVEKSPSGSVHIISLPNVINYRVLMPMLMKGRFQYKSSGILDETHLHFFDKERCASIVESAGLTLMEIDSARLDWSTNSGKLNKLTFGVFEKYLTFQYIVKAKKI